MVTGQLLGPGHHLLPTDDAHVVRRLQVLRSGVGVSEGAAAEGGEAGLTASIAWL